VNVSKAIEIAVASSIRENAELGAKTIVRPWQSLNEDWAFDKTDDRSFPCVDIRFGAPRFDENQVTLVCPGVISCFTMAEDDVNHQDVSALFEAVFSVALSIFRDAIGETSAGLYNEMKASIETDTESAVHIGGISLEDGDPPGEDNGLNVIGIGFAVHFSYL